MKLDKAVELGKEGKWRVAQVRVNPGNRSQWFVILHDNLNKSFILADNDDNPIATDDLNKLAQLVKLLSLKDFTIFL